MNAILNNWIVSELWPVMPVATPAIPKEHVQSGARNKLSQLPELLVLRN
jgi:hypothetical protein